MERQQRPNCPAPPLAGRPHSRFCRSRSMLQEKLMITLRIGCVLSAFACVAAHAQTCSGGADGGMDATGNQCNAHGNDSSFAPPEAVMTRQGAAPAAPTLVRTMPTGGRSTASPAPVPQTAAAGHPMNRFSVMAQPPAGPAHTAKIENMRESPCSGGMDGGMDATGNQCNPVNSAATVVVANVRQR
jgi:hypothetical protein